MRKILKSCIIAAILLSGCAQQATKRARYTDEQLRLIVTAHLIKQHTKTSTPVMEIAAELGTQEYLLGKD